MYDGPHPLAETAVFVAVDDKAVAEHQARITNVTGQKTSCLQVGCPFWVRVLPGSHTFSVHFMNAFGGTNFKYADLDVSVKDMKPRHVYIARYRVTAGEVSAHVEDLGENPDFALRLGPNNYDRNSWRVKF